MLLATETSWRVWHHWFSAPLVRVTLKMDSNMLHGKWTKHNDNNGTLIQVPCNKNNTHMGYIHTHINIYKHTY